MKTISNVVLIPPFGSHSTASPSRTYRIRASYGAIKGDWVEILVEVV